MSPLPPKTYLSFSSTLATALSSGSYIKPKPVVKEGEAVNPFENGQMEGAMDGMKKQAVMMCVRLCSRSVSH
jgi:hypothetical protein